MTTLFKVKAIVEIPKGSDLKYEISKDTGELVIDRKLNQKIPCNYGFIPGTLCEDGDPLDVFIVNGSAIDPLSEVEVTLAGVLKCKDNGEQDDKIIAVTESCAKYEYIDAIYKISNYLKTYKAGFVIESYDDAPWAIKVYQTSRLWPNPAD